MRKALVVGINYYQKISPLFGCVNDACEVKSVLERHADGTLNFSVNLLTSDSQNSLITRKNLKEKVSDLFKDDSEIALFYFSGHGYLDAVGGYLITSDCQDGDDGFSLNDLLTIANGSAAKNKIIIIDSCHSGITGTPNIEENKAILKEGITILTASSANQYAVEKNGSGVFTNLLVDALSGSAANLVGDITPGSVYAHIDQSLGPWEQRPLFKTNVKNFTTLRKVQPPISLSDLREITVLFTNASDEFLLDPTYETDTDSPIDENIEKFKILQRYNRVNLVVPVGEDHMYYAAMNSKSCKLTVLGVHYWNLVKNDRI
jgi:Caspase domain